MVTFEPNKKTMFSTKVQPLKSEETWLRMAQGLKEKDVITAPLLAGKQTRKGNLGDFEKNKTWRALWPLARSSLGEHKQRKWEKEVESAAAQVISSIVHLTLLLIVRSDKGSWQRWCCSIDCLVMGGDERVPVDRGGWCGWVGGGRLSKWDS